MNTRRTFIFAAIVIISLAFYYFYDVRGKEQKQEKKDKETAVFSIIEDDVKTLKLERLNPAPKPQKDPDKIPTETFTFEKNGDKWMMKEPVESKADMETLTYLVRSLTCAKSEQIVESNPQDLGKYGLKNPKFIITISDGKKNETILIGDNTIDNQNLYVKTKDGTSVFLINSGFKYNLVKKVAEYRNRTLIDIPEDKAQKVVLKNGSQPMTFEKKNGAWELVSPKIARPGSAEIAAFIKTILEIQGVDFVEATAENRKIHLLDKPQMTAEIYGNDPAKPVQVILGEGNPIEKTLYAMADGTKDIYVLNIFEREKFNKKPDDFIDHKIFSGDIAQISELAISTDGKEFKFKKEPVKDTKGKDTNEKTWKLVAPAAKDVDTLKFGGTLSLFPSIKVKSLIADVKDMAKYGLDKPAMSIVAKREDTRKIIDIKVGNKASGNDGGSVYLLVEGENNVLLINKEQIERLKYELLTAAGEKITPPPTEEEPQRIPGPPPMDERTKIRNLIKG